MTVTGPRLHPSTLSFDACAEAHLDDVYGYLLYLTHDRHLAEDLAADTFEKALRRWARFDARRGEARSWLLALARSTALDHFRAQQRRQRREERAAQPEAVEEQFDLGFDPQLQAALATLAAPERELVFLRVVLEIPNAEAARLLGLTPTNCATRLNRVIHKLETALTNDQEEVRDQ
jgi:RNA polymerase sigma-70 factor (ECF subfamily)